MSDLYAEGFDEGYEAGIRDAIAAIQRIGEPQMPEGAEITD